MDFFSIVFFLVLYYIRPYEWLSWVAALKPMMVCMAVAIFAMFSRERGFSLKDVFKTPHDWMMLFYFLWVVLSASNPFQTVGKCYNLFVFYVVFVQALSSVPRLQKFLNWWVALLFMIVALALGSEYGFDPMGSYDMTHGVMKDRLVLNSSLFNNPNALGHTVVPCLMMLYYVCYWKRSLVSKILTIPMVCLTLYCIFLTSSKGAFVSAFASLVLTYSFGRPKMVQIAVFVLAATVGYGALQSLPRMSELKKAKADPAIQGRLAAWQFGLEVMETKTTGVGFGNFVPEFYRKYHYTKASHSSYVQIGTETGYFGLMIYLGILYCNARTLLFAKTKNLEEERIRRILFAFLCGYIVSSWMVDMGFRATYFVITAATAAFHRHLLLTNDPEFIKEEPALAPIPGRFVHALPPVPESANYFSGYIREPLAPVAGSVGEPSKETENTKAGIKWNRLGIIDLIWMVLLVVGAVYFWRYLMHHI